MVFKSFDANGIRPRRGQITLIAAGPGTGKTALVLKYCIDARVPALYMSADTDATTMKVRAASMVTGHPQEEVEQSYEVDNATYYDTRLERLHHVRFSFEPSPAFDDIEEAMRAYAVTYGEWPHILVIDNLTNVWSGGEEGHIGAERTLEFLHQLGRETGSAIFVLHHLTGEYDDGQKPSPLSGLRGKVSKIPEMVLTLFRQGTLEAPLMGVAPVKNRTGKADAGGSFYIYLSWRPDTMQLTDQTTR